MLAPVVRRAVSVSATASKRAMAVRSFASTTCSRSDDHHHGPPVIQGQGAKPGTVPTDLEQSTGIERFEILSKLQGEDPFSNAPLEVSHMGTLKNPVKVFSLEPMRIVGCTGYPVDSHDPLWMQVSVELPKRCSECGCAYALDYQGEPDRLHHLAEPSKFAHGEGEKPRLKWGWGDTRRSDGKSMR